MRGPRFLLAFPFKPPKLGSILRTPKMGSEKFSFPNTAGRTVSPSSAAVMLAGVSISRFLQGWRENFRRRHRRLFLALAASGCVFPPTQAWAAVFSFGCIWLCLFLQHTPQHGGLALGCPLNQLQKGYPQKDRLDIPWNCRWVSGGGI